VSGVPQTDTRHRRRARGAAATPGAPTVPTASRRVPPEKGPLAADAAPGKPLVTQSENKLDQLDLVDLVDLTDSWVDTHRPGFGAKAWWG
jgi:hypothetical protein